MKKILLLIYVCAILIFTACSENSDTTVSNTGIDETKLTEQSTTGEAEMSDEEYLITLANQLTLGMDIDEVFFRLGEPDFGKGSSSLQNILYYRGDYTLRINGSIVSGASVSNNKTGEETVVNLSRPQKNGNTSYEEVDIINLGKRIKSDMTEREVIDELGEPDEKIGSKLSWLKYHYGDYTLYVDIWNAKDKVYRVRVYDYKNNKNTQIYVCDEPITAG